MDEQTKTQIKKALAQVLASPAFQATENRKRFLEFIVTETLETRDNKIKGYTIGVQVYGRDSNFDPQSPSFAWKRAAYGGTWNSITSPPEKTKTSGLPSRKGVMCRHSSFVKSTSKLSPSLSAPVIMIRHAPPRSQISTNLAAETAYAAFPSYKPLHRPLDGTHPRPLWYSRFSSA